MKYQVTFFVKINGNTEVIVVKANASTEYLAVARATLKYKRMFPVGNEAFEAIEVTAQGLSKF